MTVTSLRQYFPAFSKTVADNWLYLDSAATSQKLQSVITITEDYYQNRSVNVHRSSHSKAAQVTADFEQARADIQSFIGAASAKEIVWTKGATESINLVAQCLAKQYFKAGDEILISALEHHANIVPWQQIAQNHNLLLKIMPIDECAVIQLDKALEMITANTALVALSHVSNALGNINPIVEVINKAKEMHALTLIDGTQAVSHLKVDVQQLDCDFYVFSGHKMFGPTGIGVLYGKLHLLHIMPPYQLGGEMIKSVSFKQSVFQEPPLKFEAGTPNVAGVLGLAKAVSFIEHHRASIIEIEQQLGKELQNSLQAIPGIKLWGDQASSICLRSFSVEGVVPYDLGILLDERNIAIRVGHHCAMPLMQALGIDGTIRVSLSCYNSKQEVQRFISALQECIVLLRDPQPSPNNPKDVLQLSVNKAQLQPLALKICEAKGWDQTTRQLMLAGKDLVKLQEQYKTAENEVLGCDSQVWISCRLNEDKLCLSGDSPSKIVRGLLAVIFEVFQGQAPHQILTFDLALYLQTLGLAKHLSQSRGNGLTAVFKTIVKYCEEC
jgi:cysteine desulfurase/selenocysteine lyase